MSERLPWRRTFEPVYEDYSAIDGVSYARVYFNITATQSKHQWVWVVSVRYQFNTQGTAPTRESAVEQATEAYWRQTERAASKGRSPSASPRTDDID